MNVYRFARTPKWLLSHLFVALLVGAMVMAGMWQLNRLSDRKDQNERIEARAILPEVAVETLVVGPGYEQGADLEFRRVTATGTFDRSAEVLVRNRPLDGSPGRWALTPLVLEDGRAVLVNRGWIPNSFSPGEPRPAADPPVDSVIVKGWVRPTETASGLQVSDAPDGVLLDVARPNIARIDQQTPYNLLPIWIQADSPPLGTASSIPDLPRPIALPPLDDGPHLSYAVQWFVFSTIGLIGYPLVLRRVAAQRARPGADFDEMDSAIQHGSPRVDDIQHGSPRVD